MIELTVEVTIIQDVAPGMSFCNPVDTIFQSLPDENILNLIPLTCTNSSCGGVGINGVTLHAWVIEWSNIEVTDTESLTSPRYVTIGEQFNMSIMACMPESTTGIHLFVTIPYEDSVPLVSVNDAYVTFIGSELYNTTLIEGDGE